MRCCDFLDARVDFVTQAVADIKARRDFPRILKVKIVGFAANGSLVKLGAERSKALGGADAVGIGGTGEKSRKRIRQRVARLNVVRAACGWNENGRVGRAAAEGINAVRVRAEDRGVFVPTDFRTPFERVAAVGVRHVVLELVEVAVGAKDRAVGGIEALE